MMGVLLPLKTCSLISSPALVGMAARVFAGAAPTQKTPTLAIEVVTAAVNIRTTAMEIVINITTVSAIAVAERAVEVMARPASLISRQAVADARVAWLSELVILVVRRRVTKAVTAEAVITVADQGGAVRPAVSPVTTMVAPRGLTLPAFLRATACAVSVFTRNAAAGKTAKTGTMSLSKHRINRRTVGRVVRSAAVRLVAKRPDKTG